MTRTLHLLLVEDSEHDAELLLRHLRDHNYVIDYERVDNGRVMRAALRARKWDLIISDYTMPGFGGMEALEIAQQDASDIPFIIVSGNVGEDIAAAAMVAGAHDYVMKDNLARLVPAIERELKEAELRRQQDATRTIMDSLAQATYGVTGERFFYALSEALGKSLGLRYVHIGEFAETGSTSVQTLSVWHDGVFLDNFRCLINELPCAATAKGEAVFLQGLTPAIRSRLRMPIEMDVHGYMSFPLLNTKGDVTGLIVAMNDVAFERSNLFEYVLQFSAVRAGAEIERARVESRLRSSEQYLRGILDNLQDVIYRTDREGRLSYISPSVGNLLGYSPNELLGTRLSDLYVDKNGREAFLQAMDEGCGNVLNYEAALMHRDGSAVWVSTNAHYFHVADSDEVAGVEGITRNITMRKQTEQALCESEELFSKAFHCSPAMISISKLSDDLASGRFLKINDSFLRAIDYSREQVIGHSFAEMGLFAYEKQREGILALLREHGRVNEIELPFRTRTGETRFALGSIELLDVYATPCLLVVCQDITERKHANEELARHRERLEEQVAARTQDLTALVADLEAENAQRRQIEAALVEANCQAEQANLAKTDFLANMSHELRTPLNSIIGFAELLMIEPEEVINKESRHKLGYILDSGWHLLSLINDILDLSKIEAGKLVFEPRTVNVRSMVEATMVMLGEKARKAGVSMSAEFDAGIEKIIADERKLKQVLCNLVGNAIKFSNPQGHIQVWVAVSDLQAFNSHCGASEAYASARDEFVCFSVDDEGIGIDASDIGTLFKPFVQLDASLTRHYDGSGLGLHLSRQLVGLHGGCIWVESEPGKGSSFSFIIPSAPRD